MECWLLGRASSGLRVLKAIKVLSWDDTGYTLVLEEWTRVSMHQNARAVRLALTGMVVAMLGSVVVGKDRATPTWVRSGVPGGPLREPAVTRGYIGLFLALLCLVSWCLLPGGVGHSQHYRGEWETLVGFSACLHTCCNA